MFRISMLSVCLSAALAAPASAATDAEIDTLFEAMRLPELIKILRHEGLGHSLEVSQIMFPERAEGWSGVAADIYDTRRLSTAFRDAFGTVLKDEDVTPLIAYYASDAGQEVVDLELSARAVMLDPEMEQLAKVASIKLKDSDPARTKQLIAVIDANDLIDLNVIGGMNASLAFYSALSDAGAIEMTHDEILGSIYAREHLVRMDAVTWTFAYLGLAYEPLGDDDIAAYVALSQSEAGADLNRALFAGLDEMFKDTSYDLGLAAARFAIGLDL